MQFKAKYVAIGEDGEYLRDAITIDELPTSEMRMTAIKFASKLLNLEIRYGIPIYETMGIHRNVAVKDSRSYLLLKGCDLPLKVLSNGS